MTVEIEAGIVTANATALASFYCNAFGFAVDRVFEFPEGQVHRLSRGSAYLKIFQPSEMPTTPAQPDPWHARAGWGYASLHVEDLAAEVERVRSRGGRVIAEPANHRPDAGLALVADPEGNVWEILYEAPMSANGQAQ